MSISRRTLTRFQSCTKKFLFRSYTDDESAQKWFKPLKTLQYGVDIIHDPLWNKSTAFDLAERDRLGLRGLLPPVVRSLESQVNRTMSHIRKLPDDITKNLFLQSLHNRNETLYHRCLVEHIEELAPLVYTPTVGHVCLQFGNQFRRSRGMYFSRNDRGMFSSMVHNWPHNDVHVIVVTDGSRILGLGDLGVHGMGIPIGKLALYCAAGGIGPHRVMPVCLDVGTNNQHLLQDPDYIGIREPRLQGEEYFEMVDEFLHAIFSRWPDVVVQFEDFETSKAEPLLKKYRDRYRIFNDDIQGTGSVTLSMLMSAIKVHNKGLHPGEANFSLKDLRILCAGAGSAGLGVCSSIAAGLVQSGMSHEDAMKKFVVCSDKGSIGVGGRVYSEREAAWANPVVPDGTSLLEVIKTFKPNVLMGLTAAGRIFTKEIIQTMASNTYRPIILPMSNPTSRAECTAEDAYNWTEGRAIVASGSPFGKVTLADGRVMVPSQCNNMYVFPGIGLAASVSGVSLISDKMLYVAATACSECLNDEEIAEGRTFPRIQRIREVSHYVAVKVIEQALKEGITTKIGAKELKEGIPNLVARKMYFPQYTPLVNRRNY